METINANFRKPINEMTYKSNQRSDQTEPNTSSALPCIFVSRSPDPRKIKERINARHGSKIPEQAQTEKQICIEVRRKCWVRFDPDADWICEFLLFRAF